MIPFAKTEAERAASGDPRPSIEKRNTSFRSYHHHVVQAIDRMVEEGLMVCEDADDEQARLIAAGLAAGVPPPPDGTLPPERLPHECRKDDHGKKHKHGHKDRDRDWDRDRHGDRDRN